jgi:uncharacterized phiE125 gp8 family phage protein
MSLENWALITLQDAKELVDVKDATRDGLLEGLIHSISQGFESYTRRKLAARTFTNVLYDGPGDNELWLPNYPITNIASITEGGVALASTDYLLYAEQGLLRKAEGGAWTSERQGIKITYTAGFVVQTGTITLPYDLKMACQKQIAHEFQMQKQKSWGEASRSFADGSQTFTETGGFLKAVRDVLDLYVNPLTASTASE